MNKSLLSFMILCTTLMGGYGNAFAENDIISYVQGNTRSTRNIDLPVGKAAVMRLPQAARDVIVANPEFVDVVVRNPKEVYLFAKKTGMTNAFFFNEAGEQIVNLELNIGLDTKEMERIFNEQIPDAKIKVSSMGDNLLLSGQVKSATYARMAKNIATRMAGAPEKVINNITITGQEQVMIKVKVAEIQRSILKQLGIDWNTAFSVGQMSAGFGLKNGYGVLGNPTTGLGSNNVGIARGITSDAAALSSFASPDSVKSALNTLTREGTAYEALLTELRTQIRTTATNTTLTQQQKTEALGFLNQELAANTAKLEQTNRRFIELQDQSYYQKQNATGYRSDNFSVDAVLQALEQHKLMKNLAEPTLTAISGESAKFLAGGEIPYSISNANGQTVEYKPYGVGLAFTPTVLNEQRISLKISTEVSDIGKTFGGVPGIDVRRAETTVEMPSGGSIVLAGLIREDAKRSVDSAPGAKDVPVLGALFRSNSFQSNESELAIMVTPYLVEPTHEKNLSLPTDGYANPSDLDMYANGKMAAVYKDDEDSQSNDDWLTKATDLKDTRQTKKVMTKNQQNNGYIVE